MDLLEIFETGIVSKIFPSDLYAILMLTSTSKTVKNAIYGIGDNDHKVDVNFKKLENLLYLSDFSKIIKNISNKFTINKLYLQDCIFEKSVLTRKPKNFLDSYDNLKCKNVEKYYDISYLDIIKKLCPYLTLLNLQCYPCVMDILIKFKCNMPNCEIYLKFNENESLVNLSDPKIYLKINKNKSLVNLTKRIYYDYSFPDY